MVGSFAPGFASGGRVRKVSIFVPSALVAWKRFTSPSRIPERNSSFAVVRCRGEPPLRPPRPRTGATGCSRAPRSRRRGRSSKAPSDALAVHHALDRAAGGGDAGEVLVAPLLQAGSRRTCRPARSAGSRRCGRARAVSARGSPPADRHHGHVVGGVPDVLGIAPGEVGDPLAVGAEHRLAVGDGGGGDGARLLPRLGLDDEDVAVVVGVRIVGAVAGEGDPAAVGGPDGLGVVVGAGGDLDARLGGDVEDVEVLAEVAQEAVAVAQELQAVDDDRLRRLRLLLLVPARLVLVVRIVGIDVAHHQGEALAVRRPGEVRDAGLEIGELDGLAAAAVEQPDLGSSSPRAPRGRRDSGRPG